MEWVMTTGTSVEEAKDRALDQLGVAADEADFEVLEEPKTGLFGRLKAEAKVRARVKPTPVRPKQDRRQRGRNKKRAGKGGGRERGSSDEHRSADDGGNDEGAASDAGADDSSNGARGRSAHAGSSQGQRSKQSRGGQRSRQGSRQEQKEQSEMSEATSDVTPQEVGEAAVAFMDGLAAAFGNDASSELTVDGTELEVRLRGDDLGLLVGPGGRTLTAVQDLARVSSQRRLGDHETRLRIDVAGYREKRREALERFAVAVANEVVEHQTAKALEPMSSADRKVVHDAINDVEGVASRSEGDEPNRRVVITPA